MAAAPGNHGSEAGVPTKERATGTKRLVKPFWASFALPGEQRNRVFAPLANVGKRSRRYRRESGKAREGEKTGICGFFTGETREISTKDLVWDWADDSLPRREGRTKTDFLASEGLG